MADEERAGRMAGIHTSIDRGTLTETGAARPRILLAAAIVALLLSACASLPPFGKHRYPMLPGTLEPVKEATRIDFELSYDAGMTGGNIRAINPTTRERFTGMYTSARGASSPAEGTAEAAGIAAGKGRAHGREPAKAKGLLRGNRGTIVEMTLDLEIGGEREPYRNVRGSGEAKDNRGGRYRAKLAPSAVLYDYRNEAELMASPPGGGIVPAP
jgi:hypothetical protein